MNHQVETLWKSTHLQLQAYSYRFLRDKEASEDVVADCFERLLLYLEKGSIKSVEGWLFRVVRNESMHQLNRSALYTYRSVDIQITDTGMSTGDCYNELLHLLALLSANQRKALELFYFESKSYQEIGVAMQVSERQVKSYIQNGMRMLRKQRSRLKGGIDA